MPRQCHQELLARDPRRTDDRHTLPHLVHHFPRSRLLSRPETQKARNHRVVIAGLVGPETSSRGYVNCRARATVVAGRPVVRDPSRVLSVVRFTRWIMRSSYTAVWFASSNVRIHRSQFAARRSPRLHPELRGLGDAQEDRIAREEQRLALEGALGHMRVGG